MWWLFVIEHAATAARDGQHCKFGLRRLNHESLPDRRGCELAALGYGVGRREYECYVVDLAIRREFRNHCLGHRTLHCSECSAESRDGNHHRNFGGRQLGKSIDHGYG
jgi:hypothetical protein